MVLKEIWHLTSCFASWSPEVPSTCTPAKMSYAIVRPKAIEPRDRQCKSLKLI